MMSNPGLPHRHEQQKIDKLLLRLSKIQPVSPKPAPMTPAKPPSRAACGSNLRVFFST